MKHTTTLDDLLRSRWGPEIAWPMHLADRMRGPAGAELRLMAAMFEDAVSCLSSRQAKEFREACEWLFDDGRDWPFSFTNVCELLDLDVSAVRLRLRSMIERRQPHADTLGVLADAWRRHLPARRPVRSRGRAWREGRAGRRGLAT
jgi:hypothetical protein